MILFYEEISIVRHGSQGFLMGANIQVRFQLVLRQVVYAWFSESCDCGGQWDKKQTKQQISLKPVSDHKKLLPS